MYQIERYFGRIYLPQLLQHDGRHAEREYTVSISRKTIGIISGLAGYCNFRCLINKNTFSSSITKILINRSLYVVIVNPKDLGKCCALRDTQNPNHDVYNRPKGKFSINYLRAITSFLGFTFSEPEPGDDVFYADATVRGIKDPDWIIRNPQIDFQAKTRPWKNVHENTVNIQMETKTLNHMRHSSVEHLLVVLCIKDEPEKWIEDCENGLLLHERMYWYNPRSETSDFNEDNDTVTIHIPINNRITKKTLHQMIDIVGKGGEIGREL